MLFDKFVDELERRQKARAVGRSRRRCRIMNVEALMLRQVVLLRLLVAAQMMEIVAQVVGI